MAKRGVMNTLKWAPKKGETPVVRVPLSKSVANRWLILRAFYPDQIYMHSLSDAKDTAILQRALEIREGDVDLGPAGTAMRFSTAFFSVLRGADVRLFGTERMHERPIEPLVDALRSIGADVEYEGKKGYPPLKIQGKHLRGGEVRVPADMSSQFISALMLIATATYDGLLIHRTTKSVSQPYVDMTAHVLRQAGISVEYDGPRIHVHGKVTSRVDVPVEGDWSAAAAFVAWVAVSGEPLNIEGLSANSVQGDKALMDMVEEFGIEAQWDNGVWKLERTHVPSHDFEIDLLDYPDLAQPLILAAVGQGRSGKATGLRTLRIKETDRIAALVDSIEALGGEPTPLAGSIYWSIEKPVVPEKFFKTYDDHRMAMALAPMATLGQISLDDVNVVDKSFPKFWEEMKKVGLEFA